MQATSLLTDKQRAELNRAVLAYLATKHIAQTTIQDIHHTLNASDDTTNNINNDDTNTNDDTHDDKTIFNDPVEARKQAQVLEKKWTSVVRLQRKVLDMETQISNLKLELENSGPSSSAIKGKKDDPVNWLPRAPAKYSLSGHRQPITAVAVHKVFNIVASSSEDGTIKIWDWELGEFERTIKAHTKSVVDVDFDQDEGKLLASCSSDLTIKLWDVDDDYNNIRTLTGHDHTISAVRFVPGGAHLVSCSRDQTIRVWDVKTGYALRTIQQQHTDWIKSVEPSVDGAFVLSAGIDQTAKLTQLSNGEPKLQFIGHDHVIEHAVFAPVAAHKYLSEMEGVKQPVESQFSSSFEYVATASRDKTIKIWNTRQEVVKTLVGHDNWVRHLCFHPGGKYLLSVSDDKSIKCWDLSQQGRCTKTVKEAHQHFVSCLKWAPQSDTSKNIKCVIATGSVDLQVKIWA